MELLAVSILAKKKDDLCELVHVFKNHLQKNEIFKNTPAKLFVNNN